MKLVIQRVKSSSVAINNIIKSEINQGLLVFIGIEDSDDESDIDFLTRKLLNMRLFNDENGKMNLSLLDINGEVLVISQFTLHASTKKGNRPSYIKAAKPEIAIPLYEKFVLNLEKEYSGQVKTGEFGADMLVKIENDGPVTILIDSKNRT